MTDETGIFEELERKVLTATDEDLLRAAEAVVDAALCCHGPDTLQITERARQLLISTIYHDPSLTAHLFNADSIRLLCRG